jgi:peptide/nickel transport system substrate-binding protein
VPNRSSVHRLALVALVMGTLAVLGAACSSGNGTDASGDTTPEGAQAGTQPPDTAPVQPGGKVTFGLEANVDGLDPTQGRWAISDTEIGLAVYDPLAALDAQSHAQPYLAKSFDHNADYTQWTIGLRSGITFSNGDPLDAAGLVQVLQAFKASGLVGPVFAPVKSFTVVDPMTVRVDMSSPWAHFPVTLTSQAGVVPDPKTLPGATGPLANTAAQHPIGTGPFVQAEFVQNKNWRGTKNPTYWRKDKDGAALPYLDQLEFTFIPDDSGRDNALSSGSVQMMHTTTPASIAHWRDQAAAGKVKAVEDDGEGEEDFVMLNNAKPPFDDPNLRRALGYAVDIDAFNAATNDGLFETATGPFRTNSPWYAQTKNYPNYDPAKAKQLVDAWKAAHGGQTPTFEFGVGGDTAILQKQGAFLQQAWQAVGFDVTVKTFDQVAFILNAVGGNYTAYLWRQFGAPDPDFDYIWWTSANATGSVALNIARHKSTCVDDAITRGRQTADTAARKAAYADLQQCFADEMPYVFLDHVIWMVVADNNVHGITNGPLPDGQPSLPIGGAGDFGGVVRFTQTWIEH